MLETNPILLFPTARAYFPGLNYGQVCSHQQKFAFQKFVSRVMHLTFIFPIHMENLTFLLVKFHLVQFSSLFLLAQPIWLLSLLNISHPSLITFSISFMPSTIMISLPFNSLIQYFDKNIIEPSDNVINTSFQAQVEPLMNNLKV